MSNSSGQPNPQLTAAALLLTNCTTSRDGKEGGVGGGGGGGLVNAFQMCEAGSLSTQIKLKRKTFMARGVMDIRHHFNGSPRCMKISNISISERKREKLR